jgi:hypothetical protein
MPPADEIIAFLRVLTWVGGVVLMALSILVAFRTLRTPKATPPAPLPQPLAVTPGFVPVDRTEFAQKIKEAHGRMDREKAERAAEIAAMKDATEVLREKVDREVAAMRELVDENNKAGEARATRIHDRVDKLGEQIGHLPGQIVALLRGARDL